MSWNVEQITLVALDSARADHAAFEAIGLAEMSAAHVLDVGCLDGFNTHLKFAPYDNIERIVGIDPNIDGITHARNVIDDTRFSWKTCTLKDFQADPDSFDVVYLSHTFQHLPDKPAMLERILQLLKPGGFAVIKTVDDSMKTSSPDPEHLMDQVLAFYDKHVRPFTPHTLDTDRYNGSKCYSLLKDAGFDDVRLGVFHTDTAEKTTAEREALFERMTYFRRNVPACQGTARQADMDDLLTRWHDLFIQDDYFFDTPTVMAIGRKPADGQPTGTFRYHGPAFSASRSRIATERQGAWALDPMRESDLGEVMRIELASFPDPWTPLAYATEIRHNPQARYMVARDGEGTVRGYIGWWNAPDAAIISHIAVDASARKSGIGRMLVEHACRKAAEEGKTAMVLQVREKNNGARAFYEKLGFRNVDISKSYYTNPDDNGVIMTRTLHPLADAQSDSDQRKRGIHGR